MATRGAVRRRVGFHRRSAVKSIERVLGFAREYNFDTRSVHFSAFCGSEWTTELRRRNIAGSEWQKQSPVTLHYPYRWGRVRIVLSSRTDVWMHLGAVKNLFSGVREQTPQTSSLPQYS